MTRGTNWKTLANTQTGEYNNAKQVSDIDQ